MGRTSDLRAGGRGFELSLLLATHVLSELYNISYLFMCL